VFVLQVLAVNISPDRFLLTLMSRFEVLPWFGALNADSANVITNDVNQFASVAEDLLQLIIVVLTERSRVNGLSERVERRRELIHHLALYSNGIAFTELGKRVSNRLFDMSEKKRGDSMDDILGEIASFKFPEGSTDRGLYELKSQFYGEVDPWFWHYSRNQREEIELILAKREKKSSDGFIPLYDFANRIVKPNIPDCNAKGAFRRLDLMKSSIVLVKMVASALWNVTRGTESDVAPLRNDAIFASCLHLIMVSLDSPEFVEQASSTVFQMGRGAYNSTLLGVMLELLMRGDQSSIKEFVPRLKFILKHFETHADVISWRARLQAEHASKMAENEDAEKKRLDKRREEAKARRDQIKAKFNTDQEKFQMNYEDELDDMGNDADKSGVVEEKEQVWAFPHGTCIVCQEATDKDGILSWLMSL
jgi:E3 ubiquitin-protein ligase UBR1